MADWTKAELSVKVLEYLGVKPAGQSASAADDSLVQSVIDSVFSQLDVIGLVTFASSAIPDWAQWPLTKWVGFEAAVPFGITGQRLAELAANKAEGRRELEAQTAGKKHNQPTRTDFF